MINIKRILCPTDLSQASDGALRYAVALARVYQAKLFVLHCAQSAPLTFSMHATARVVSGNSDGVFENSLIEHLGLSDFDSLDWEGIVIESEHPAREITREAAQRGVDLIVMRSRRRPLSAALLGSNAESVCRTAPCPVLITHPEEREWVNGFTGEVNLKRLLVPYDFSDHSELALKYALSLAQEYQAELHLLHVLPRPARGGPEIPWGPHTAETAYHTAARRLQKVVPSETFLWCDVVRHSVRWGKPYQEILAYAAENQIELVAMGAHGAEHGMNTLFGSNVDRVLRQSPCPVFVARPLRPLGLGLTK